MGCRRARGAEGSGESQLIFQLARFFVDDTTSLIKFFAFDFVEPGVNFRKLWSVGASLGSSAVCGQPREDKC